MKKLLATTDDYTLTLKRLTLGIVFSAWRQKLLGWFGGYGFSATIGAFTSTMHIPAPLAFLAIAAEFFGSLA